MIRALPLIYGFLIAGILFMSKNTLGYMIGLMLILISLFVFIATKNKQKKKVRYYYE